MAAVLKEAVSVKFLDAEGETPDAGSDPVLAESETMLYQYLEVVCPALFFTVSRRPAVS